MNKIALGMIVKNEAHCIERCLDSVKPIIDLVYINDNGSTDGTDKKVENWCEKNNVPLAISRMPWESFDVNRSHVLSDLYTKFNLMDYVLMIDADEVIVLEAGFNVKEWKESLVHDIYDIESRMGCSYLRAQLTSNKKKFSYRGVVHEFLQPLEPTVGRATVKGLYNMPIQDSARNKDPEKFRKDAEKIKEVLDKETDPFLKSRYTFYLAQSYKDSNQPDKAIPYYQNRVGMGFWNEEEYMACIMASRLMKSLKAPVDAIIPWLVKAIDICPYRAEAFFDAMTLCRENNMKMAAYTFGYQGIDLIKPQGSLFTENYIYDYELEFQMSILSYYVGKKAVGEALTQRAINNMKAPPNYREQSKENFKFYLPSTSTPAMSAGT